MLAAFLILPAVVGLLPDSAYAHFALPGLNGARISLGDSHNDTTPIGAQKTVTGKSFVPNEVARIFECPYGATDLLVQCQVLGTAQTDANGGFTAQVTFNSTFTSASGQVLCQGFAGPTMCAVAAATYSPLQELTSHAQHYVCFQGGAAKCTRPDEGPTTTTTTTLPPPGPEWEPAAPMATPREHLATAVGGDGLIYALGGNDADGNALTSVETYDSCRSEWSSIPAMPAPRTGFGAATGPDGRIYVIGGTDGSGTPLATVDVYDPGTRTWSSVANLTFPRTELAATTGSDGRIYAIGGRAPESTTFGVPTVEAYDPGTNQWQFVTPLSSGRFGHEAVAGSDGRIYILGGDPYDLGSRSLEYYSPGPAGTPGIWQESAAQYNLPPSLAAAVGPDGHIYAIGGYTSSNGGPRVTSVYDPASDTWTASTEALITARADAGAALGRDGRIYAIGGIDVASIELDPPPLSSVEVLQVGPNNCPAGPPPPADFDGDGDTDVSVFRPETGTWFAKDGATSAWGAEGDIPVPGDYDGDRITDVAIFRPDTGLWAIDGSAGVDTFVTYGIATDVPVPADYDGDGKTDIAVYRPDYATWWVHRSSDNTDTARTFGLSTDVPVPGDYDGDGSADLGIFRDGTWFVQPASGGSYTGTTYGIPGDVPVPGDYDADRSTDMAVFRPSDGTWALHHSSDGVDEIFGFGIPGDVPVPGDYDGDWRWDPVVFRPSTGEWFVETGQSASWGAASDIPLPLSYAVRRAYFGGLS